MNHIRCATIWGSVGVAFAASIVIMSWLMGPYASFQNEQVALLASVVAETIEEIVASDGDLERLRKPRRGGPSVDVIFGELPMWTDLLTGAQALAPEIPAWCWRDVAEAHVWLRGPINSAMVVDLARFFLRHVAPHS